MSLTTTSLMDTVKKQYLFKLKGNIDSLSALIGIQVIGILFSLGGVGSIGSGSQWLHINVKYYSADLVIAFSMFWAFVTAITITTKPNQNHDFTFVTNRLSSSLSNIFFLMTASLIGAVTAMLSSYVIQLIGHTLLDETIYASSVGAGEFFIGLGAAFLYIFCVSSLGYLIGALVQLSKLFIGLIPIMVIGSLYVDGKMQRDPVVGNMVQFYIQESSFGLFFMKILITTALLFAVAMSILNRMEVRR